ncbi:MAG TPA: hypothetical protein VMN37_03005 [Gemmatimonadales bacterium]|nr:hypothetical protein [Gemmatimonadales bacterium]
MPAVRPLHAPLAAALAAALATAGLGGCRTLGRALEEAFRERPAAPLDSLTVASDVRLDSAGVLAGSFVGEGTSRAVHLLSSDTAVIAELARRHRSDLLAGDGLWPQLARRRAVTLGDDGPRRTVGRGRPEIRLALVGSPLGHTEVTVESIVLRGSRCGWRGSQAELVVRPDRAPGDPPLRGPVLGVLLADPGRAPRERGLVERPAVPEPSAELTRELLARTGAAMDSTLAAEHPALGLRPLEGARLEVNTLADLDAADVIAFRAGGGRVRYAVSLRERRVRPGGRDTLVATAVMVWDSAGAWRQAVFRPTLLAMRGGRLEARGHAGIPLYWRRLQPISDVAYPRDNLWMEQVNVRDGTVLWGIVQPQGNVVVAAAEMEGGCGGEG